MSNRMLLLLIWVLGAVALFGFTSLAVQEERAQDRRDELLEIIAESVQRLECKP